MGLNHSPRIITNGLVLALDAGNAKSYSGSGTTWTDLSGNGNNGTLISSPTYNASGYFTFNGVSYVSVGNDSSLQLASNGTVTCWFNTSSPGSGFRGLITKQFAYGLFLNSGVLSTYDWTVGERSTGINLANGLWNFVALTFTNYNATTPSNNAIVYYNGSAILTTTIKLSNNGNAAEFARGGSTGGGQLLNGSISSGCIYNRALTADEIQQNFNAIRGRFGV